ncbi:NAD(P)-binding protein [Irpex rosettiformis]|uniref:NAD(P)-binding protein n=1 Tax=Irpex rosettiformis TaxID=378272 RepID=A0ACB8TXI8_9APHY|nr:NAD(P)-binding protein [Irpex rosettiformis]
MSLKAFNVVIFGGHGKVSLRLTRLLTSRPNTAVTSIIRNPDHAVGIQAAGATPLILSLEDNSVFDLSSTLKDIKPSVIYFCAGSGGIGGPERLKAVDEDGAIKVFDAIESLSGSSLTKDLESPRLILLSSLDVRDTSKPHPEHYTPEDIKHSAAFHQAIGPYLIAKYNADKNLSARSSFKWTILRPNWYMEESGVGKGQIGKGHLSRNISRDDVAKVLFLLLEREGAHGLGIDLVGGEEPLEDGLDTFIRKGESDFVV